MEEEKKEETVEETVEPKEENPVEEVKQETPIEEAKEETPVVEEANKPTYESKKKNNWWKYVAIFLAIVIIILLLLKRCGKGNNYKITIHNGDEIIEVDKDFKLSDLDVKGGIVSFLVDSDGHIVDPSKKLDPKKEYSTHIIPEGKETVKVTYKNGSWSLTVKYQKGAGLLFPADPTKEGYVFLGWMDEDTNDYPIFMTPVTKDMVLVAQFAKPSIEGGKCKLNCDTNKDGVCDLNCDKDGDGKPDTNIDLDGDGKCDLNCDANNDGICDLNCDTNGDGKPDTNIDKNGDGICDLNCDANNDGKCDYKCDTDGDGKCDKDCDVKWVYTGGFGWTVDCEGHYAWYAVQCTKAKGNCISFTWDDKNIEPKEEIKEEFSYFDFSEYVGSGKSYMFDAKFWVIDKTGQKYYQHYHFPFIFEGNCNTKPNNNCADTNEDGKCDEDLVLLTDDYDIEVGCKVGVTHRQTKKGVLISSTINGEEVEPDETLDDPESKYKWPTWYLTKYSEIGEPIVLIVKGFDYNENDEKYEYVYTSKISFTEKCTNPDEPSAPNPEPEPTPGVTYTCPSGYTLSGTKCTKTTTDTKDARVSYSCENGFRDNGNGKCVKNVDPVCPSGYEEYAGGCVYLQQIGYEDGCDYTGPVQLIYNSQTGMCEDMQGYEYNPIKVCRATEINGKCGHIQNRGDKRCPDGSTQSQTPAAFICEIVKDKTPTYTCPDGYDIADTKCKKITTETINATVN